MNGRRLAGCVAAVLMVSEARAANWDLSRLPDYHPQPVSGVVRQFGSPLGGLVQKWEEGFRRRQPGVRFEDNLSTGEGAVAGLVCGISDLGPSGREPALTELEAVYDCFPGNLLDLTVATGTYDVRTTWSIAVFVNRDNPVSRLSLRQLDGIFGAERSGGYRGYRWSPESARGPEKDLRTWGQIGLTGEWAGFPIHTYGYAFTGMTQFFEQRVFGGGDKWNPNYREYVESGSKMIEDSDAGRNLAVAQMLEVLSRDKGGIAWTGIPQAAHFPQVKPLALAAGDGGAYVLPTLQTVRDRTYPLTRSVYLFLRRVPGRDVPAPVCEFLKYVLSRQGQEDVAANGRYLPLTAQAARAQLRRLGDMAIQKLIDEMTSGHPDLPSVGVHARLPEATDYTIVAHTSRKAIGKKSDAREDRDAILFGKTGGPNPLPGGIYDVTLPLYDSSRRAVGAVAIHVKPADGTPDLKAEALRLATLYRDAMARRIASETSLFEPVD